MSSAEKFYQTCYALKFPSVNKTEDSSLTMWSSSTKDESTNWYTFLVLPLRMDDGTLASGSSKSRVRMGSLALTMFTKLPVVTQPVNNTYVLKKTKHF